MEIRFRLNGKQVQAEVRPDTVLLDLVRELGCYSVKRAVKQQTVACVLSGWTESPYCHVPLWLSEQMDVM